ncbi:MAG: hypothetical protein AB8B86_08675 [Pseudomonadales bacterium]
MSENTESVNELDALFAQVRDSEPYLDSSNFVDAVMQQVPPKKLIPNWVASGVDIASALLGVLVVMFLFGSEGLSTVLQWLPQQFEISIVSIALVSGGIAILSFAGWWAAENLNQ